MKQAAVEAAAQTGDTDPAENNVKANEAHRD
jgi:hypothetical protein